MSNCSNHRKDVHGETDMQHLAEEIGNLHYEVLAAFLYKLSRKLLDDAKKDFAADRKVLGKKLLDASLSTHDAHVHIYNAWVICQPHMLTNEAEDEVSDTTKLLKEQNPETDK